MPIIKRGLSDEQNEKYEQIRLAKKSLERRILPPDQLDAYIHVQKPGLWTVVDIMLALHPIDMGFHCGNLTTETAYIAPRKRMC